MVCVRLCYSHIHMSEKTKQHTQNEESLLPAKVDAAAALSRADASEGGNGKSPEPTKRIRSVRDLADWFFDSTLVRSFRAQLAPGYLDMSFLLLFWIFITASILGLALEDIFHVLVYGGYESRAGFVWGPFSPIYGVGAVVLTLFLNRFYYTHDLVIFLVAMVLGAMLEYGASWMMETFWHAIAWDYTGTFGSINGRTNFFFGVMWGTLGLFWVRFVLPVIKAVQQRFTGRGGKLFKIVSWLLVIFIAVDAVMTVLALHREGQRAENIPPATQIDVMLDEAFPDWWLQERFHNMTVSADVGKQTQDQSQ